jgi:paraquat-inducible protein B
MQRVLKGKTTIKSRSVDVGVVESATLTDDLTHVEIKARLNSGMEKLMHSDSVFWVVKPQVGREGISGLGTLLSGAYIELQPGTKGTHQDSINCWIHLHSRHLMQKGSALYSTAKSGPAHRRRSGAVPWLSRWFR